MNNLIFVDDECDMKVFYSYHDWFFNVRNFEWIYYISQVIEYTWVPFIYKAKGVIQVSVLYK